jgi:DNA polymerase III subunit alpha
LKATRMESLTELMSRAVKQVNIRLKSTPDVGHLRRLHELLRRHPGPTAIYLTMTLEAGLEADTTPLPNLTVLPSELFVTEVEDLLGKGAVALL